MRAAAGACMSARLLHIACQRGCCKVHASTVVAKCMPAQLFMLWNVVHNKKCVWNEVHNTRGASCGAVPTTSEKEVYKLWGGSHNETRKKYTKKGRG